MLNRSSILVYLIEVIIAKLVLKEFPVSSLIVSVSKPGAMRGSESVGISITRP